LIVLVASVVRAEPGMQATTAGDGLRELTVSGCLLRSGYAGYQLDDARLDAIAGKPVPQADASHATFPKKWSLEGGGNLGPRVGAKVVVIGRSDWRQGSATASPDEPPAIAPTLTVESVKTVAERC
jgi:hypothetical protein